MAGEIIKSKIEERIQDIEKVVKKRFLQWKNQDQTKLEESLPLIESVLTKLFLKKFKNHGTNAPKL